MQVAEEDGVKLVADGEGGYIFTEFKPWFDAMASVSMILNLIAQKKFSFNKIRESLPVDNRVHIKVPCAWEEKGTIMRNIMEKAADKSSVLVDGVKINIDEDSWVLLIPDFDKPYFNIYAEGPSKEVSLKLTEEYKQKVQQWKK
jgi:mannose-1-phosphate guanylyltransferase/phosphomannomutase